MTPTADFVQGLGARVEGLGVPEPEIRTGSGTGRAFRCSYDLRFDHDVQTVSLEARFGAAGPTVTLQCLPGADRRISGRDRLGFAFQRLAIAGPLRRCRLIASGALRVSGSRPGAGLRGPTRRLVEDQAREAAACTGRDAPDAGAGPCLIMARATAAALHTRGLAPRCVTGLVAGLPEPHAWIEIRRGDGGWTGFDPSRQAWTTGDYLPLADADDGAQGALVRGSYAPAAGAVRMGFTIVWSDQP